MVIIRKIKKKAMEGAYKPLPFFIIKKHSESKGIY